jgi:hypothetical protein
MLLKPKNSPLLEELETEIENEGKRPSPLKRLIPLLPKLCFYGFFSLVLLYIVVMLADLSSKVQREPVFVELRDGSTTVMQEKQTGYRSKENIHGHILGILPLLLRMSNKLPAELGGGKDEGVIPVGMEQKVPRAMYAASFNLSEDGRIPILRAIASEFPKGMWDGDQKLLRIYNLEDPVKTDEGYMVYMVASFYPVDKTGQPQTPTTFNREIHLMPVEKPRFILKPDPLQLLINGLQRSGLMINYIKARKGE